MTSETCFGCLASRSIRQIDTLMNGDLPYVLSTMIPAHQLLSTLDNNASGAISAKSVVTSSIVLNSHKDLVRKRLWYGYSRTYQQGTLLGRSTER